MLVMDTLEEIAKRNNCNVTVTDKGHIIFDGTLCEEDDKMIQDYLMKMIGEK